MAMSRRDALSLAVLAGCAMSVLVAGCATGPQVRAEADPHADFSRYHTFGFEDPLGTDRSGYQTIVSQYLKEATRREMEARGFQFQADKPDLLVNFNAELTQKVRVTGVGPYYGYYGPGYYGYRGGLYGTWPMYPADTWVSTYHEGTLNVDVVDRAKRQMVWEGVAVDTVTEKTTENLQAAIDTAVSAVFAKFPIAPKAAPAGATK